MMKHRRISQQRGGCVNNTITEELTSKVRDYIQILEELRGVLLSRILLAERFIGNSDSADPDEMDNLSEQQGTIVEDVAGRRSGLCDLIRYSDVDEIGELDIYFNKREIDYAGLHDTDEKTAERYVRLLHIMDISVCAEQVMMEKLLAKLAM
jgi:hypothetical protein